MTQKTGKGIITDKDIDIQAISLRILESKILLKQDWENALTQSVDKGPAVKQNLQTQVVVVVTKEQLQ